MTRRFVVLGLLLGLSQLSSGCCWRHYGCWRPLCSPCAPACAPTCAPSMPMSVCASPIRPGCAPCESGGMGVPPVGPIGPGGPAFSSPIPIGPGPMVYPGQELGNPTPVNPAKN